MEDWHQVAAELLDLAANQFSNHGCNDFYVSDTEGMRSFLRAMYQEAGMTDEESESYLKSENGMFCVEDHMVMAHCARRLRGA